MSYLTKLPDNATAPRQETAPTGHSKVCWKNKLRPVGVTTVLVPRSYAIHEKAHTLTKPLGNAASQNATTQWRATFARNGYH